MKEEEGVYYEVRHTPTKKVHWVAAPSQRTMKRALQLVDALEVLRKIFRLPQLACDILGFLFFPFL